MISLVISAITLSLAASASDVLRARSYIFEAVPNGVGSKLIGIIDFEQTGSLTKLNGSISGLKPGQHGFHVHEKGDIGNGCLAAGSHFNPHKMNHGGPSDANRHVGDLGNINTPASGDTPISVADSLVALTGIHSVIGRAVVVHEKIDDLGKGGASDSLTTGAAGARLGCGVIGVIEEIEVTTTVGPLNDEASTNYIPLASTSTPFLLGFLLVLQRI